MGKVISLLNAKARKQSLQRRADFELSIDVPERLEAAYNRDNCKIEEDIFPRVNFGNQVVEFEPCIYSAHGERNPMDYNVSLRRSRMAGYSRHAYPSEIFKLTMLGLGKKLPDNLELLYKDICIDYQDIWLGLAFERVGNSLAAYVEPENLDTNNPCQDLANFKYSHLSIFDVSGLPPRAYIDIDDIDEKMVKFLYEVSFRELYSLINYMNIPMPQIVLPSEGRIWPVSRNSNCNSIIGGVSGYGRTECYSLGAKTIN